jgi:hypothetical protein
LSASLLLAASAAIKTSVQSQTPVGPAPLCAVTSAEFATWKAAGSFVPPDSANFDPSSDCKFYKWSSQMFLWLTTKDTRGNLKMFSPQFENAVEDTSTGAFQLVANRDGLDAANETKVSFRVRVNKPRVLLLKSAKDVDTDSTGQAGGGVLIVNGKAVPVPNKAGLATYPVVYYAIEESDVFTALKENWRKVPYYRVGPNKTNFPITLGQATEIQKAAGKPVPNLSQLAIEVKSAWVDTAYLTTAQAGSLVRIKSEVPAFSQSIVNGQLQLTWDGSTMVTRTLALVGMHVVGSVNHHPEMVWATFESNFNSPDATYSYLNQNYDPGTKACKSGTTCLNTVSFSTTSSQSTIFYNGPKGAPVAPDVITQTAGSNQDGNGILATSNALVATSVARLNPWGSQQPATPTPTDPAVLNNTLLVSLMQSLQPRLAASGSTSLANYFLVGAVWSNRIIPPQPGNVQIGSLFVANTTMETFQQVRPGNPDPNATANNCFSCHGDFSGTQGTSISHVFPNTVVTVH